MAIDFSKMMDEFIISGSGSESSIKQIYDIIPTFSQEQIKVLSALRFFIVKYNLKDLQEIIDFILSYQTKNKSMSFWEHNSVKQMLKTSSLEELVKGVKPQIQHLEKEE